MFRTNWHPLSEGVYAIGGFTAEYESSPLILLVKEAMPDYSTHQIHTFNRVYSQGMVIYSKRYVECQCAWYTSKYLLTVSVHNNPCRYKKVTKRNSYTVQFGESTYGEVEVFVTNGLSILAIVTPLRPATGSRHNALHYQDLIDKFVFPVERSYNMKAVSLNSIKKKCILIESTDCMYLSVPPNT